MALDPNIFFRGAALRENRSNNTFNMLQGLIDDAAKRKAIEEQKAEMARKEAMSPQAVVQDMMLGRDVSPERMAALKASEAFETRKRAIDPVTGEVYQQNAPLSVFDMIQPKNQPSPQEPAQQSPMRPAMPSAEAGQMDSQSSGLQMPDLSGASRKTRQEAEEEFYKKKIELQGKQAESEMEKQADQPRATQNLIDLASSTGSVEEEISKAIDQISPYTAGAGSYLALIRGTPASDLARRLDTIKADAAFDRLQQMREASKTGGALGAVSQRELELLQSSVAALGEEQSPKQLKENLKKYMDARRRALKNVAEAYKKDYGEYPEGFSLPQEKSGQTAIKSNNKIPRYNPQTGDFE